ncbi:MAG: C40 family peptidase, partial [Firmicutes bacterium]|nr:C40 family peptidase [Bacillota bacterium]
GKDGTKHVVKDVVMENGEYAGSKVLDQEVTDEAVTKVIYEGTKLSTRDKGELLVQYATRFLGTKYVWGGTDLREGTDCSGYTMRLYEKVGITIPRTSYSQENIGEEVEYEDAQPGDLVLYPGHVGIYMGDNKMIHATDNFVKITDDCRYRKVLCIRRIFTDEDNVTQETFDELFKEEYNEGAEEIAKEKLAELKYETMTDEFVSKYLNPETKQTTVSPEYSGS